MSDWFRGWESSNCPLERQIQIVGACEQYVERYKLRGDSINYIRKDVWLFVIRVTGFGLGDTDADTLKCVSVAVSQVVDHLTGKRDK